MKTQIYLLVVRFLVWGKFQNHITSILQFLCTRSKKALANMVSNTKVLQASLNLQSQTIYMK